MSNSSRRTILNRLEDRFHRLYGDRAPECVRRLKLLISPYEDRFCPVPHSARWSQGDNVLITYGDMVHRPHEKPLKTLCRFLQRHAAGSIDTVHLLPFFPSSGDDGFSVIDYERVDPTLGAWSDVQALAGRFRLMFDLVLNHCSRRSQWFRDYVTGVAPARDYFIELAPDTDLSSVVRPRATPLLSAVETRVGERWVWTTFSSDQVDLNFANPDVTLEFIDILLLYISMGARIIRLDAIAYLWKQLGTSCIHLPQTHEVVKIFRDVLELVAPHVILLTETNVPHEENISYFGSGDEAHMVYNFSLPPLLLHALQTGSARHLTEWCDSLAAPPSGCTFLNFTASHDGIGVRPAEGLLPDGEIQRMAERTRRLGGHVSERATPDGSTSPYELNITYLDALADPEKGESDPLLIDRFLCSQAIMLALRGIPGIYFHSLVGTRNDHDSVQSRGMPRAINRHKWDHDTLETHLADPDDSHAIIFERYRRMLATRCQQPAFHPDGIQNTLRLSDQVFAIERISPDGRQKLLSISNVTPGPAMVELSDKDTELADQRLRDLLHPDAEPQRGPQFRLAPYQTLWLTPAPANSRNRSNNHRADNNRNHRAGAGK